MTRTARAVLEDCKLALSLLENEKDLATWRVHWVGAVALIRAVGHVLIKVDAKDASLKVAVDGSYSRWKRQRSQNAIFWDFINQERNSILKEYIFNFHPLDEVEVAVILTVQNSETGKQKQVPHIVPIGENIYRPILDGYREGGDARDVYQDALDWWESQLSDIESEVKL